jgi:hypothetical protein
MYYIDIAVFAPGEKKWTRMRQLDAVAFTFRTAEELSAEAR